MFGFLSPDQVNKALKIIAYTYRVSINDGFNLKHFIEPIIK